MWQKRMQNIKNTVVLGEKYVCGGLYQMAVSIQKYKLECFDLASKKCEV